MTCWWRIVTCEIQEITGKKVQITTFTKLQSMSDPSIINLTKQLGHLGKFLTFSRGIWFLKQNTFLLEYISVYRSSHILYLAIYLIEFFDVASNRIVLSREIVRSLQKQQKVTPFYAFRSVTKIIEVVNFPFLQPNPCIRCSWWVHECFMDKF